MLFFLSSCVLPAHIFMPERERAANRRQKTRTGGHWHAATKAATGRGEGQGATRTFSLTNKRKYHFTRMGPKAALLLVAQQHVPGVLPSLTVLVYFSRSMDGRRMVSLPMTTAMTMGMMHTKAGWWWTTGAKAKMAKPMVSRESCCCRTRYWICVLL